ncbi:hypothetical protein A2903_01515 [Candidatus Nomurabacteria bacterium RIFCSPLOWO2_01_FULL_33_17]|uniref:Tyr recombinase domain-containing protein n=1 Tax=Candidatus Nomurabacteria bacterium RIFCSPLOWO2_01_FULL_33_17 TaxID=1801764 RepID=A0A1F6WPR7_9BACT|nr:MAG: hypothetical protein A2903_01515 [Candidatus Nomurabacteria bacterium RIFCSPLOWO2_01_FULL_33_17]
MAEDDIYSSKKRYEGFKKHLADLIKKPSNSNSRSIYYCKNQANLRYFEALMDKFEVQDQSYVRRLRLLNQLKIVVYCSEKDLVSVKREDIDKIIKFVNKTLNDRGKKDFVIDIKYLWKQLFPEKDEKERIDERIVPYEVRHLSSKIDKSREKLRNDKFTWEEYERLVNFFSDDPKMQAYITLSLESLSRPQELCYTKIKDCELYDNYAKIWISSHGKEGTKFLSCIDSFPYLVKWLNIHPFKTDTNSYLFVKYDKHNPKSQLTNKSVNERLRNAVKKLMINKQITCYSLKRMGVTFRILNGDAPQVIQKIAGWKTMRSLHFYDQSKQEEVFNQELVRKGKIPNNTLQVQEFRMTEKECLFCNHKNKFTDTICNNCKRPLDREKLREIDMKKDQEIGQLKQAFALLVDNLSSNRPEIKEDIAKTIKDLLKE